MPGDQKSARDLLIDFYNESGGYDDLYTIYDDISVTDDEEPDLEETIEAAELLHGEVTALLDSLRALRKD